MKKKIAVIGGGIVGATASYYSAKAGYSVSVFTKWADPVVGAACADVAPSTGATKR